MFVALRFSRAGRDSLRVLRLASFCLVAGMVGLSGCHGPDGPGAGVYKIEGNGAGYELTYWRADCLGKAADGSSSSLTITGVLDPGLTADQNSSLVARASGKGLATVPTGNVGRSEPVQIFDDGSKTVVVGDGLSLTIPDEATPSSPLPATGAIQPAGDNGQLGNAPLVQSWSCAVTRANRP